MEPMDYTMDSDHLLHQHQHHQPQQNVGRCPYAYQSNPYNAYMPPRDTHHYDPVHNTDSWYQPGASTNPSSQPSYASQPSHWANNRYYGNTWHTVGGERAPYNSQIPFHMPGPEWLHPHGFPLPFGYGYGSSYSSPSSGNGSRGLAETSNPRTSAPVPSSAVAPVNIPTSSQNSMMQTEPSSQQDRSSEPSMPSFDSAEAQAIRQRLDEVTVDRAAQGDRALRDSYRNPMEEQRASYTRAARIYARTYTAQETAHWQSRRHRPSFGSSDDADDDSDDLLEHYHHFFPRDESSLAALRGIAASKRVTSKSAMASLEQVDLQELKEGDRTCIICYNEFGVKNPEGVVENPIRLPKCKHVFGNACIKKWFEDSDSCPYCRDKLPSEPLYVRHREIIERLARESREAQQLLRSSTARNSTAAEDVPSGSRNTEAAGRNQDQLHPERRMAQNSPPSRFSPTDSPENSRRRRGRMGVHRALPPPRPFNQQAVYRTSASFANTANSNRASYVPQRNGHVPSRNTTSSSQEEASPPIVVGSSDMREQNNRIASEHESDNSWTAFDSSHLSARVTRPEASNSPPAVSIQTRPNLSSLSQHSASESSLPTVSDINAAGRHQYNPWVDIHPSSTRVAQYPRWSS